jgi:hypothetical protein
MRLALNRGCEKGAFTPQNQTERAAQKKGEDTLLSASPEYAR